LISQFKYSCTDRGQWSVITGALALLQLPQLESQVIPGVLRESLENLSGVALPNDRRIRGLFYVVAHESEYISKTTSKYTIKCISPSREKKV
jgi:hypothetical protein